MQGDTIDLICWRYLGGTDGLVELVLQLNPRLADLGPVLPMGTVVTLPKRLETQPKRQRVTLWD